MIIPPDFFSEDKKPFIRVEVPYCQKNEEVAKRFLTKFHDFTQRKFNVAITWKTKKVRQLFSLKEKNPYPATKIYLGECKNCNETYVGETIRNVRVRWNEHENPNKDSEPARHLRDNPNHNFNWSILCNAPTKYNERKNLEASFIGSMKPSLNEQVIFKVLTLFRNGIT